MNEQVHDAAETQPESSAPGRPGGGDEATVEGTTLELGDDPGLTTGFVLEATAVPATADPGRPHGPGAREPGKRPRFLGDYEVLDEIGRGGMAVVYRARQGKLDRLVALKVIRDAGGASLAELRRFRSEAEVIAQLDHPHIVPIYEVGQSDDQPFFSMKLFSGGNLLTRTARLKEDPRAAARLMAKVARAVHFAHQRTILHRDIKPSNILLDEQGEPYVSDFGLAKRIEQGDSSLATLDGAVMGTPAYMPPEQARGEIRTLTTAVDVYSLGATLYETLVGQPPFSGGSAAEILRRVLDEEPPRPRTINARLDRDLETICLTCLRKDSKQRYGSAEDLAEDLERWLDGRPITARPVPAWERGLKWANRHKAVAGLLAFSVVALATLFIVIVRFNLQLREALDLSNRGRYAADMTVARRAYQDREVYRARELLETYRDPNSELSRLRGFEWNYLWGLSEPGRTLLKGHTDRVTYLSYHPQGVMLASGSRDRTIRLWDLRGESAPVVLRGHEGSITGLAFDREGKRLASTSEDRTVRVWEVASGRCLSTFTRSETTRSPCFSPEGASLLNTCDSSGEVTVWDLESGQPRLHLRFIAPDTLPVIPLTERGSTPEPNFLALFSADGRWIFSTNNWWPGVTVRDARTGALVKVLGLGTNEAARRISLSADGRTLRVWGIPGLLWNFDATSLEPTSSGSVRRMSLVSMRERELNSSTEVSPDGSMIATSTPVLGRPSNIRELQSTIIDMATERIIDQFETTRDDLKQVVFDPNSRAIAWPEMADVIVRRLTWKEEHPAVLVSQPEPVRALAVSGDESLLAWTGETPRIELAQSRGPRRVGTLTGHRLPILALRFGSTPAGPRLVSASVDGTARLWDPARPDAPGTVFQPVAGQVALNDAVLADEGRVVVTAGADGSVGFWDAAGGRLLLMEKAHEGAAHGLAVSPDGSRVVSVGGDGLMIAWNPREARRVAGPWTLEGPLRAARFSPDGSRIAVVGSIPNKEDFAAILTASRGQILHRWRTRSLVRTLDFSPEGLRVISAGSEHELTVWDPITGRETITLPGHAKPVLSLVLFPKTLHMYTASQDGTIRLWEGRR